MKIEYKNVSHIIQKFMAHYWLCIIYHTNVIAWYDAITEIEKHGQKTIKLSKYEAVYIDNLRMHLPYSSYV